MDDNNIEKEIQTKNLNSPRVTPQKINMLMSRVVYMHEQPEGTTSTFVHAYLDGKFFLATGHSACVSEDNFNAQLGKDIAISKAGTAAKERLWELEGYKLYMELNDANR